MLILAIGLVLAQSLTFLFVLGERSLTMRGMMVEYLSADVASSVAMLDRLPSSERGLWLERLKRPNYQLRLGDVIHSESLLAVPDGLAKAVAGSLSEALAQPVLTSDQRDGSGELRFLLRLQDGSPVSVVIGPPALHLSPWLLAALAGQFALLGTGCWLVVRQVTRPLSQLAVAARSLKPGQPGTTLPPDGPREVLEVTEAFDQMRHRIDEHLEERVEMLGAISHDLQTPITRMRLRAEMLRDEPMRDKLQGDLAQMQHLVEMGLAYARTSQAIEEPLMPTDLVALLESIVADYQDAGQDVVWLGGPLITARTRPKALHRIVVNLIDNSLKFAGAVEVSMEQQDGKAVMRVMDRGPGIPPEDIDKVTKPFYRVEGSRSRETGGTGLGLAIVQRLLVHCQGDLALSPREGGGLVAAVRIPL
ncbi:ATP-binding protein [Pelomonas aquatica]|jgi:signal transduction histidine kinase|uniref:histidine kinase n=1 Tax=Pelomonas aquatica TaxID=431058 RepID=A0A9X4LHH1_9BURK|nr:ATP-binding protein [Pelomonas aquatica]MCY4755144.1 ATP-binding protein [Pelomonas aquatica]MDG0863602.1 HAMP domain-containing protein [Pelomonas aquatica]